MTTDLNLAVHFAPRAVQYEGGRWQQTVDCGLVLRYRSTKVHSCKGKGQDKEGSAGKCFWEHFPTNHEEIEV